MNVRSTRSAHEVPLAVAIARGQAPDGGLYMPPELPPHRGAWGDDLCEQAQTLLAPIFAGDELAGALPAILTEAFTFDAPTRWIDDATGLLELFHGPTAAFKDFGARFLAACLARLEAAHSRRNGDTTVLVATSGDTGAAVAAAFHGRARFRVVVLYPDGRVSPRQAHQLGAFGDNVTTFRVAGTFDDCQRLVKEAFAERELSRRHRLTSANSISIGRLLPQMAYYARAALQSVASGRGAPNFVVPTGNLGNAFACLLAKERGLPIGRVVLATNRNRVLPDFLATGSYEPRESLATLANAMDVGAPSNLERLRQRFAEPSQVVEADWVDDASIRSTVVQTLDTTGQVVCPHTACGLAVLRRLRTRGAGGTWIVAATAHPAKFETVIEPLIGRPIPVPPALAAVLARPSHATALSPSLQALAAQLG
ncbi:MAG TPA: threonine synthase [Planctomycetota bacterium]|nr:threonine synthase [Planctomycetota bacterium]